MPHYDTRQRQGDWKVLRTGLTALTDDDWADDASDDLPSTGLMTVPLTSHGTGVIVGVEFIVWGYVNATGFVSDNDADSYSVDATFLVAPPRGSSIIGRDTAGESLAFAQVSTAGHRYFRVYRIDVNGADALALRLHSSTGAPGAADRYEVWWREVMA